MKKRKQPTARSWIAVAAHLRNSAGTMGGSKKATAKRSRQQAKKEIRNDQD
jgi:hypothetical protein